MGAHTRLHGMIAAAFSAAVLIAAPIILNATPTARAGDYISIQGAGFGSAPSVWLDSATTSTRLTVLNQVSDCVVVKVPLSATGGLSVRVQNGLSSSTPTSINAAKVYHLDALSVVPGGAAKVFGRNLLLPGFTPTVTYNGVSATVDVSNSNEHMLSITVPNSITAASSSTLFVNNGAFVAPTTFSRSIDVITGATGDYFNLGVGWAACFTAPSAAVIDTTTDPRMSVKVVADGTTDNSAALQRAVQIAQGLSTGAIVKLPAGNVRLASGVELGSKVILQGAGKTQTTVSYTSTSFPIFCGNNDTLGVCDLTFLPVGNVTESVYLHDCSRIFVKNVRFSLNAVHPTYLTNNRNMVVTNCDFTQSGARDDQGPLSANNSKGFVFTNNTSTVFTGGCTFAFSSDGYVGNNHFTRDNSYTQTPSTVIHMMPIDFAARIAIIGNTFDVINGPVNSQHNDGETILTEGGGNARTENLGTVKSATATTITDTSNTLNANPLGTGSIPENYGVAIVGGKGMGQSRRISAIAGGTITVDTPWAITPDGTSRYATMVWGLEKSLIKGNTLAGNSRGIMLYQTAVRDVDILSNTLTQNGGIYLRSYQNLAVSSDGQPIGFMPIWNVKIKGNVNANSNGLFPANVGLAFYNHDGKDFGIANLGIHIQDNEVTGSNPTTESVYYDSAGRDGYYCKMQCETSYYETPTTPRVLCTIFQGNKGTNFTPFFRLGTGANGTVIADSVQNTAGTLVQYQQTSGSTDTATNTVTL